MVLRDAMTLEALVLYFKLVGRILGWPPGDMVPGGSRGSCRTENDDPVKGIILPTLPKSNPELKLCHGRKGVGSVPGQR